MIHKNGGYLKYRSIMKDISFANIANLINLGSPVIKYLEIDDNNINKSNTFIIELIKPIKSLTYTYLKSTLVNDYDKINSITNTGFRLENTTVPILNEIYRNKSYFNPKTYTVLNFLEDSNLEQLKFKTTKFFIDNDSLKNKKIYFLIK